jgi:hypothetical protein
LRRRFSTLLLLTTAGLAPGAALADPLLLGGDGSATNNPALGSCYNVCAVPVEDGAPFEGNGPYWQVDASIGLRGSYSVGTGGNSTEGSLLPSVTLTHEGRGWLVEANGAAEFSIDETGALGTPTGSAGISADYALDSLTVLSGDAAVALSQERPGGPGVDPDIAVAPLELSASAEAAIARQFGRFTVTGSASAARDARGDTVLVDSSVVDNSAENSTTLGGGLRLAYELTPILSVFTEVGAGYEAFDAASPTLMTKLDGWTYSGAIGVSGDWRGVWRAEASIGLGLRDFNDPMLTDATTALYSASLTYTPNGVVEVTASFDTELTTPDVDTSAAAVEYSAGLDASYRVTRLVTLRAGAEGTFSTLSGLPDTELSLSAGAGVDYRINDHLAVSADYLYARNQANSDPVEDEHTLSVGVTLNN